MENSLDICTYILGTTHTMAINIFLGGENISKKLDPTSFSFDWTFSLAGVYCSRLTIFKNVIMLLYVSTIHTHTHPNTNSYTIQFM